MTKETNKILLKIIIWTISSIIIGINVGIIYDPFLGFIIGTLFWMCWVNRIMLEDVNDKI